ncbi:NAD(P)-binding domain-containing protein, partial [Acinetobacter baumannii]|uniref:NAD(P)-binding domain-containing protein n=1 Tax=Acinetobacter baumannii TaxID=470 RepID=UPI000A4BE1CF
MTIDTTVKLSDLANKLVKKFDEKSATIGVVGLGYVGLPLAVEKAKAGFDVIGFDVQKSKVDMVNQGINYIGDVVDDDLRAIVTEN